MNPMFTSSFQCQPEIIQSLLRYSQFLAKRDYICNTLGNIALRSYDQAGIDVIYTKHKGISLEEMSAENIIVTQLDTDALLYGTIRPSIGHQLNREIFKYRHDIHAVIHLHVNEIISYFSVMREEGLQYVSNDTALVLAKPVVVLPPQVNVEVDQSMVKEFIHITNCFVMPHHGITTLGRNISEAYHRMTSFAAEIKRLMGASMVAAYHGKNVHYISEEEVKLMNDQAEKVIYG